LSYTTIAGKIIPDTIDVENVANIDAIIFGYEIDDDLDGIVTVEDFPLAVPADDSREMEIEVSTHGLSEGLHSGVLTLKSSVGNDTVSISVNIVGDLSEDADDLLAQLEALWSRIEAVKNKEGYDGLITTYNNLVSDINQIKDDYDAGSYSTALSLKGQVESGISSLILDIEDVETFKKDYGGVIWTVAGIIVIGILGVVVWRYKDKIMEFINRFLGRRKEPQYKEPEYYPPEEYPPEDEGDYRTDYY